MATLAFAFLIAFLLLGFSIMFQLARRKARKLRLQGLELRPNCLLTRYPIAFISGRPSLFRLFDHWNEVPSFLREHGYEVLILEPTPGTQGASLLKALDEISHKCHLIADSSSREELEIIAQAKHPKVASLTWVKNPESFTRPEVTRSTKAEDLRPLQSAIEIFEMPPSPNTLYRGWQARISRVLLAAHNRLIAGPRHKVDAAEICELDSKFPWDLESRFLDLAVFLAERDAQWNS
jgi:hypothetical protein